jgi:hypothetical protein
VEFVHLAADLGCHAISMKARTGPYNAANPYGYADFSFLDDAGARREMAAALRERAVATYRDDSSDRLPPGEGELPLVDILLALPASLPVGVEVPMRSRATAGMPARTCAQLAVEGARGVLAQVGAKREDAAE